MHGPQKKRLPDVTGFVKLLSYILICVNYPRGILASGRKSYWQLKRRQNAQNMLCAGVALLLGFWRARP